MYIPAFLSLSLKLPNQFSYYKQYVHWRKTYFHLGDDLLLLRCLNKQRYEF